MPTQLEQNTATINECITLANSLPEAGSGSSVNTCNLEVILPSNICYDPIVYYTTVEDGVITSSDNIQRELFDILDGFVFTNVMCNSFVYIMFNHDDGLNLNYSTNGAIMMDADDNTKRWLFNLTQANDDANVTIEFMTI